MGTESAGDVLARPVLKSFLGDRHVPLHGTRIDVQILGDRLT
jgi:hypothetical protein